MNYEQVDLNALESFTLYLQESNIPQVTFDFLKNDNVLGLLEDDEKFRLPFFSNIAINQYNALLDKDHSIAVNSGHLKVEDLENYSYAGLLEIEMDVLLKSAEIFCRVAQRYCPKEEYEKQREMIHQENKHEKFDWYEELMAKQKIYYQNISKLAQTLVDRFYKKILDLSATP